MPTVYCYIRESHLLCAQRGGTPILTTGLETLSLSGNPSPSLVPSSVFFRSAHIWYVSFPVSFLRKCQPQLDFLPSVR